MTNHTMELMYGLKPVHRDNPQAGESEWYYYDPRGTDNFSDMKKIDVPSENSPNPYADEIQNYLYENDRYNYNQLYGTTPPPVQKAQPQPTGWSSLSNSNIGFSSSIVGQHIDNASNQPNNCGLGSKLNDLQSFGTSKHAVNTESPVDNPTSYLRNVNKMVGGFSQNKNFVTNPSCTTAPVLQNQISTPWSYNKPQSTATSRNNPITQVTTIPEYDNYLTAAQRIQALKNGKNLRLHIDENPQENGDWKRWCDLEQGNIAVNKYKDVVDKYANQYNVDPDLVKAIMFAENACGYYYGANKLADYLGLSKSQLPMNIRGNIWSDFQGKHYNTKIPEQNIELGTRLIKQIYDSIEYPTPEKVTTIWNSVAKDKISSFGYRGGTAYKTKPWLNNKGR